jgi:cytochrome c oxidase assembly protein subunit 15
MVVIGGITRLTGSGLSIVEWRPVTGILPPLSDADWGDAFGAYQRTPQYRLLNGGMQLAQFQRIFFWEYVHRLVGRLLGVVFLVPLVGFVLKRSLSGALARRLAVVFALVVLQGGLGWFMVKSGLVAAPNVSHYRLAAHLTLALVVLGALFWTWLDLRTRSSVAVPVPVPVRAALRFALHGVTALLALQIVYGAFTAGLHAGVGYNSFPKMHGRWVPFEALALVPAWRNAFENPATVQFLHRAFGSLLVVTTATLALLARAAPRAVWRATLVLVGGVLVQFSLGVATLVLVVPVSFAALHQLGACLLVLAVLRVQHAAIR